MQTNQAKAMSEKSEGYFSYFFGWIPYVIISSAQYTKYVSIERSVDKVIKDRDQMAKKVIASKKNDEERKAIIEENQSIIRQNMVDMTKLIDTIVAREATIKERDQVVDNLRDVIKLQDATIKSHEATIKSDAATIRSDAATIKLNEAAIKMRDDIIKERDVTIEERDATIVKLKGDLQKNELHNESLERMVKNSRSTAFQCDKDAKRRSSKKRNLMLAKKIAQRESEICKNKFVQVDLASTREGEEIVLVSDRLEVVSGEESSKNKQLTGNDLAHDEMHALLMGELLQNSGSHAAEIQEWKRKNEILAKRNTYLETYLASPIKDNHLLNELTCNPSGLADDILLNIFSMNEKATEGKVVNIADELLQLHKAIHKISQTHRDIEGEYALILNRILNATVSVDDNMRRTQRRLSPEEFRHFRSNIEEMIGKYMDLKRDYNEKLSCR